MDILNKKQKIVLIIIVTFILLFIGYYIINKANKAGYIELDTENDETENYMIKNEDSSPKEEIEEKDIIVYMTGEVKKQGIVKVKQGSRISDAIDASGGISSKADLSKINLAYVIQDGEKIYVPSIDDKENISTVTEEAGTGVIQSKEDNSNKGGKVNINKASQTEFETLTGIGPSTALKIINYRNENGEFKKIDDLKNVPGIGDSKFENIKNDICV